LSTGGSTRAIVAALLANAGIAVAKFVGYLITGSSSMMAESVHSVADTSNQALLLESRALKGTGTWWRFIQTSRNPELPVVLLEDSGALVGLVLALFGTSTPAELLLLCIAQPYALAILLLQRRGHHAACANVTVFGLIALSTAMTRGRPSATAKPM